MSIFRARPGKSQCRSSQVKSSSYRYVSKKIEPLQTLAWCPGPHLLPTTTVRLAQAPAPRETSTCPSLGHHRAPSLLRRLAHSARSVAHLGNIRATFQTSRAFATAPAVPCHPTFHQMPDRPQLVQSAARSCVIRYTSSREAPGMAPGLGRLIPLCHRQCHRQSR